MPSNLPPSLGELRAAQKKAAREEDARALEAREISREELQKKNGGAFAFPPARIKIRFDLVKDFV
jgi:hypothetical protein